MWKAYLGLLAFVALGSYVAIHIQQDKNREIAIRQANSQVSVLTIDNIERAAEIGRLNLRIKQANDRLTAKIEADQLKVKQAQAKASSVQKINDQISSELAAARAKLRGSQNPTLTTWAGWPVPADAVNSLRESAESNH